jgi:hypothetical protein
MAINRNPSNEVTQYFRPTSGEGSGIDLDRPLRELLDFYKGRLKALGWEYTTDADPLISATSGQQLYYLIFVSKVEPARRIMKWVQEQPNSAGQLRFKF